MVKYILPIEIQPLEEGGYLARSPALPGFLVQADTVEEVVSLAPGVAQTGTFPGVLSQPFYVTSTLPRKIWTKYESLPFSPVGSHYIYEIATLPLHDTPGFGSPQ